LPSRGFVHLKCAPAATFAAATPALCLLSQGVALDRGDPPVPWQASQSCVRPESRPGTRPRPWQTGQS